MKTKANLLVFLIICFYGISFFYTISLSPHVYQEPYIDISKIDISGYLLVFLENYLGQKTLLIEIIFLMIYILNIILLYKVSKFYVKKTLDSVLSVFIYSLLPGVNNSAIFINYQPIIMLFVLLFLYLYHAKKTYISFIVIILSVFISKYFWVLYLSMAIYGFCIKNKPLFIVMTTALLASLYLYGFVIDTRNIPQGYFLNLISSYITALSPLLFIYICYCLYRMLIRGERNALWFISFFALSISIILSLRQKVNLEIFIPYIYISMPIVVKTFLSSYRSRLPRFRTFHKASFIIILATLILTFLINYLNHFTSPVFGNW